LSFSRRSLSGLAALAASTLMLAGAPAHAAPGIDITSLDDVTYTNDATFSPDVAFSGATPNEAVTLEFGDVEVETANADAFGNGTIVTDAVIAPTPGPRMSVQVRVTDTSSPGNNDAVSVRVDEVPSFVVDDDEDEDTTDEGDVVTQGQLLFKATNAIPGEDVLLLLDGETEYSDAGAGDADEDGNVEHIGVYDDLTPGSHTARLVSEDSNGVQSSPSAPVTFTVAEAPAQPQFKDLFDGAQLNQSQPTLNLTGIDADATKVTLYHLVDGDTVELVTSTDVDPLNHTATITPTLPEGMSGLIVKQTARGVETGAGEAGDGYPDQVNVVVDTAAPTLLKGFTREPSNEIPWFYIEGALKSSGSGLHTNIVELYIDGKLAGTDGTDGGGAAGVHPETFADGSVIPDGAHTAYAVTVDDLGHRSTVHSNTVTFTLDTTAPGAPAFLTPANGAVFTGALPSFTVRTEPGANVSFIVDYAGEWASVIADSNGDATFQATEALANGTHTLMATASDALGNWGETTEIAFTVSVPGVTPPVPPTPPTNPTPPTTPMDPQEPKASATPAAPKKVSVSSSTLTKAKPVTVKFTLAKGATVRVTITKKVKGKTIKVATVNVKYKKGGKVTYKLKTKLAGKTLKKGKYEVALNTVNGKKKSKSVSTNITVR
jgi:hypothetical protein